MHSHKGRVFFFAHMRCRQVQMRMFHLLPFASSVALIRNSNGTVVQINKSLWRSLSFKSSLFWGAVGEGDSEMFSVRKVTWKILEWRILLRLCSHYISFNSFQMSSMLFFGFFLLNFTFPLLHMNRFDGTFTSFIHPILVFLRIKVDEECFQWCKLTWRSIPISIQIGMINWLISQLQDLFIVPDTHQNKKIGLMSNILHPVLQVQRKDLTGWARVPKHAETLTACFH